MVIYGIAILSSCLLVGLFLGQALGRLAGMEANVGGVGIAMLLLIVVCDRLESAKRLQASSKQGIMFWSSIYIPIVVAMAASQDVANAVGGGVVAITAGVLVVVACFALVPLVDRFGRNAIPRDEASTVESESILSEGDDA